MNSSVDQVLAAFAAYERALADHDVQALNAFFVDSSSTRRFGVDDEQVGFEQICIWRRTCDPVPPGRYLEGTLAQPLGEDVVVVTTRFGYGDAPATGRQTQVWVREARAAAPTWLIAAAHVSEKRAATSG